MKTRDIIAAINAVKKAKTKLEKMNEKYPKLYKEELEETGKHVIAEWYASYNPIYYNRNRSLYHAFRVNLDGLNYSVDFDAAFIGNEIIFENSFMEGYHGGARSGVTELGEPHPAPGIPYWKTPIPEFTHWGRPALRSFSPYTRMTAEMNKVIKKIDKEKQQEFDGIIEKASKAIEKLY